MRGSVRSYLLNLEHSVNSPIPIFAIPVCTWFLFITCFVLYRPCLLYLSYLLCPFLCCCLIQVGSRWVKEDCSSVCHCQNGELNCTHYECSEFAECDVRNGIRDCYCEEGFVGNGQQCVRGKHVPLGFMVQKTLQGYIANMSRKINLLVSTTL